MRTLLSPSNPKIKETKKLLRDPAFRRESGLFVAEGIRLVLDIYRDGSGLIPEALFITPACLKKNEGLLARLLEQVKNCYFVSEDVAKTLSDTVHPQGILARFAMSFSDFPALSVGKRYAALENIQDAGNLGAILRTAEALGIDGAFLISCCDVFSPKALRAAMGAVPRFPVRLCKDAAELFRAANAAQVPCFACVPAPDAKNLVQTDFPQGAILFLGNEGDGLRPETIAAASHRLTIPMYGNSQSLGVLSAASILFWELCKQPRGISVSV